MRSATLELLVQANTPFGLHSVQSRREAAGACEQDQAAPKSGYRLNAPRVPSSHQCYSEVPAIPISAVSAGQWREGSLQAMLRLFFSPQPTPFLLSDGTSP